LGGLIFPHASRRNQSVTPDVPLTGSVDTADHPNNGNRGVLDALS
jgi:hypothetical protein